MKELIINYKQRYTITRIHNTTIATANALKMSIMNIITDTRNGA